MRKLLLIMASISVMLSALAQTGSMVREDRVWNYMTVRYADLDGAVIDTIPDYGYHFEGLTEKEGHTYMSFCNGDGEEVALMRQEGPKVYIYLDYPSGSPEETAVGDVLLYNLDAQPGIVYSMGSHQDIGAKVELIEAYSIRVGDNEYGCERIAYAGSLQCPLLIVDGVGPEFGTLSDPAMTQTTGYEMPCRLQTLTDREGNVIFENSDFRTDYVSLLPQDREWEYIHSSIEGDQVRMEMFSMWMDTGRLFPCMEVYEWSYTVNPFTGSLTYNGDKTKTSDGRQMLKEYCYTFCGYYGKLFIRVPENLCGNMDERVALVCDYDATVGDDFRSFMLEQEMYGLPKAASFLDMTVTGTSTTLIAGRDVCTVATSANSMGLLWVEGLGNTSTGIIPFVEILNASSGDCTGYCLNKVTDSWSEVIYRSDAYVDIDNLSSTDAVHLLPGISPVALFHEGDNVTAPGLRIMLFNMEGKMITESTNELSTAELPVGIYICRAGGKTLKIITRPN